MQVSNKWNCKKYLVVEIKSRTVRLMREDGTEFEIAKSEFYFSYFIENS